MGKIFCRVFYHSNFLKETENASVMTDFIDYCDEISGQVQEKPVELLALVHMKMGEKKVTNFLATFKKFAQWDNALSSFLTEHNLRFSFHLWIGIFPIPPMEDPNLARVYWESVKNELLEIAAKTCPEAKLSQGAIS